MTWPKRWSESGDLPYLADRDPDRSNYLEYFRTTDLSCGVYRLAAGEPDLQSPHTEDEVYYVVEGNAMIQVDAEEIPVSSGSIVFVPANASHRFHSIVADLVLLVVFGPAEGTRFTPERPAEP